LISSLLNVFFAPGWLKVPPLNQKNAIFLVSLLLLRETAFLFFSYPTSQVDPFSETNRFLMNLVTLSAAGLSGLIFFPFSLAPFLHFFFPKTF